MVICVIAGLAMLGGAVASVLDRPFARDPRRNVVTSVALLGGSALVLVVGLGYGAAGWF